MVIKPKISTYISLSSILLILMAGLIFILRDFAYKGSFGLWFYLMACSLITLVILLLLVKMMAGYRFITAGKDQLTVRLPLRGYTKVYPIAQIMAWDEELITVNKRQFKQLTIAFTDKQSISVSNHEHEAYVDLVDYLSKKAGKQKIKNKRA
jgi:hypothetical protein